MYSPIIAALTMVLVVIMGQNTTLPTLHTASSKLPPLSYYQDIQPIIQEYCLTCHAGTEPVAGLSLESYEVLKLYIEEGNLLDRINNPNFPMPQGGLMPIQNRKLIEQWAKEGFLKGEEPMVSGDTTVIVSNQDSILVSPVVPASMGAEELVFFELMQGHWVGEMTILGQHYSFFPFDYRAISPSHVHGIYEGGTMGNLFTSFFVTDFNGKRTIMARNGGLLNGIYRTSYFVLDKVELTANRKYFRLVDAYGGQAIMWMELEFVGDKLLFKSYTSRFGLNGKPQLHMKFKATKKHASIAKGVAQQFDYPQNEVALDFSKGLPMPNWGSRYSTITSASYIHQAKGQDLLTLAQLAGDPYTIADMPFLAKLKVELRKHEKIQEHSLILYLSKEPLTVGKGNIDLEYGYIKPSKLEGVFAFPELVPNQTNFTFTYLHPDNYYLTVVADVNKDGYISKGDITSKSHLILVAPNRASTIVIDDIEVEN